MRRAAVLLAALALGACSGQDVLGQVASSPGSIGTGEQRVMVAVVELSSGAIVTDPDIIPVALLRDEIGSPIGEYEGEFVWTIPDEVGLYSFRFDIPGPATYQFTLQSDDLDALRLWSVRLQNALMTVPQVADVASDQETRGLQTSLVIDRVTAARARSLPCLP